MATHLTRRAFVDDRRTDNRLAGLGVEVRRLAAVDVLDRTAEAVDVVPAALRRRGWRG